MADIKPASDEDRECAQRVYERVRWERAAEMRRAAQDTRTDAEIRAAYEQAMREKRERQA